MSDFDVTPLNRVKRLPDRGHYDRETIYPIVDAGLICHVAFVVDGRPFAIPTLHARDGDTLLLHGASTSRMLRHLAQGGEVCVTVTHVDGLVLAKSVFNHSINYRSAVLFGRGRLIEDEAGKMAALAAFTEKILPGRWAEARLPNAVEMKATSVIAVEIESASAKIRTGPPHDDDEDLELPVWVGVLPITQSTGAPIPAGYGPVVDVPSYLKGKGSV